MAKTKVVRIKLWVWEAICASALAKYGVAGEESTYLADLMLPKKPEGYVYTPDKTEPDEPDTQQPVTEKKYYPSVTEPGYVLLLVEGEPTWIGHGTEEPTRIKLIRFLEERNDMGQFLPCFSKEKKYNLKKTLPQELWNLVEHLTYLNNNEVYLPKK